VPETSYDRIAHLYEVDMARSMPFDDAGFYAAICREQGGRVLELGCGTGRILLQLLDTGIDAVGIDRSGAMLDALRARAGDRASRLKLCRMDVRALGFDRVFGTVLCPYSLITYMTAPDAAALLLAEARRVLVDGGVLAIDAFIPRASVDDGEWRLDYRRPFGDGVLERSKRVTPMTPGVNRIERVYRVLSAQNELREEVRTDETLRPFAPDALLDAVNQAGFAVSTQSWDYGFAREAAGARFFALTARALPPNC
jgi:SAM-dependent methyltransferase